MRHVERKFDFFFFLACFVLFHDIFQPNTVAERLEHLFRIREAPGSSLGPDTGYRD
jgi:hypothetical protein